MQPDPPSAPWNHSAERTLAISPANASRPAVCARLTALRSSRAELERQAAVDGLPAPIAILVLAVEIVTLEQALAERDAAEER